MQENDFLNIDGLGKCEITRNLNLNVVPSKKLFRELGNVGLYPSNAWEAFVENSISYREGEFTEVRIIVNISRDPEKSSIEFIDNSSGFTIDELSQALSPASRSRDNDGHFSDLGEHGMGMIHAIQYLGKIGHILTKKKNADKAIIYQEEEMDWGERTCKEVILPSGYFNGYDHGTSILIKKTDYLGYNGRSPFEYYYKQLFNQLGAKFRYFLTNKTDFASVGIVRPPVEMCPKTRLRLRVTMTNHERKVPEIRDHEIKPCLPVYQDTNNQNLPFLEEEVFEGSDWKAVLQIGYAASKQCLVDRYGKPDFADCSYVPDYTKPEHPFAPTKTGLEIFKKNLQIAFWNKSRLSQLGIKDDPGVSMRGEIHVLEGFTTTTKKDDLVLDRQVSELITQIKERLKNSSYWKDSPGKKFDEDRMVENRKNSLQVDGHTAEKNQPVGGTECKVDLFVDGKIIEEHKAQDADARDIGQLLFYIILGQQDGWDKVGYMVSPGITPSAEKVIREVNNRVFYKDDQGNYHPLQIKWKDSGPNALNLHK